MKGRVALLFLGSFLLSYSTFTYLKLTDLTNMLAEERNRLLRMSREISFRKGELEKLRETIRRERLQVLSEKAALERLLNRVDILKRSYTVEVVGDLRKENSLWKLDLILEFTPRSGREIAGRVRNLLRLSSPLVDLEGILVDTEEQKVSMRVTLIQPFTEETD